MNHCSRHILIILLLGALSSCDKPEVEDNPCGEGQLIEHANTILCVNRQPITETGFRCPVDLPHMHLIDEWRACSGRADLSKGDIRAILIDAGLITQPEIRPLPNILQSASCLDPSRDHPTVQEWVQGVEAVVVGTVVSVSPRLVPAWAELEDVDPFPVMTIAECAGGYLPALTVTLGDVHALIGQSETEVELTFGASGMMEAWSNVPYLDEDGWLAWWPDNSAAVVPSQVLGGLVYHDPHWDVSGPAGTNLFLVTEDEVVNFQSEGNGICGPVIPDGFHGATLQTLRDQLEGASNEGSPDWSTSEPLSRLMNLWGAICVPDVDPT